MLVAVVVVVVAVIVVIVVVVVMVMMVVMVVARVVCCIRSESGVKVRPHESCCGCPLVWRRGVSLNRPSTAA